MFQSVGEIALEAENQELRRKLAFMERQHGPTPGLFLGMPVEEMEMAAPHPDNLTLPKLASWVTSENGYAVPCMIGKTADIAGKRAEISFYCTPHPASKNDYINVLGALHERALEQLATMYGYGGMKP